MHEMQTIVTDVRGVCLSVCHAAQLGFAVQKWLNRFIKMLFGVNTPGGPWNTVLDGGPDPPKRGRGEPTFKFWDTPHISGMAEARELKFCVHIEGWGP